MGEDTSTSVLVSLARSSEGGWEDSDGGNNGLLWPMGAESLAETGSLPVISVLVA